MPDITMCIGRDCTKKSTCYRYTATPKEQWQSYFVGIPYKGGGCTYYWPEEELHREWTNENSIRHRNGSISQEDSRCSN